MSDDKKISVKFNLPVGIKKRKDHLDKMMQQHPDINHGHVLMFFNGMDDPTADQLGGQLDSGEYGPVADQVRMHVVRELVRKKVREVVRKQPGGGGYVLYSPNKGKKKGSKAVGHFPTRAAAKRAELSRFPPKDPAKLARLRKEVERLRKDPKKRIEKENLDVLRTVIGKIVAESLFREEKTGSEWDEYIGKLSGKALAGDKKFQKLQQNIEKKTQSILEMSFNSIKAATKKEAKLKNYGVKKSAEKGKTYLTFGAELGEVMVEPIYIYVEHGVPKIEVSEQAKVAFTKAEPDQAKIFRAELVTVQERVLDKMDDLLGAITARDKYLEKLEDEVDGFIAGLTPLQVSLLKQILTKKYRKTQ